MSQLFSKAARGLKWTSFSSIGITFSQFTLGIILARLLSPTEFGLVAMVTVIIAYANILVNFGFGTVLVQKKETTPEEFSGVFWLNLALSLILFSVFMLSAKALANFYNEPIIRQLTYFLAPILVINAIGICHKAKLEKAIDLKPVAVAEMVSVIVSTALAIVLAIYGYGVWSLVAMALLKAIIYNGILIFSTRWVPYFHWRMEDIRSLFSFSGIILTNQLAEGAAGNVDRVLVGKVSGSEDLGAYEKAKNLMLLPTMMVASVISRVLLPTLSAIQDNAHQYAGHYAKILAVVACAVFPMIFGLQILSSDFIPYLFGGQWIGMVPLFQIICWAGLFTVLNVLTDNVVIASGNQRGLLKLTFVEKPFMIAIFFFGIIWGAEGVAIAYVVGAAMMFFYKTIVAIEPLPVELIKLIKPLLAPLLCSVLMYSAVYGISVMFLTEMATLLRMVIMVLAGVVFYAVLSLFLQRANVDFLLRIIQHIGK